MHLNGAFLQCKHQGIDISTVSLRWNCTGIDWGGTGMVATASPVPLLSLSLYFPVIPTAGTRRAPGSPKSWREVR